MILTSTPRLEAKLEAKLAEQRREMDAKAAKMEAKLAELTAPEPAAISGEQVAQPPGGAAIILDTPHYISHGSSLMKYNEGCLNGSAARWLQVAALQARLDALHATKLLADEVRALAPRHRATRDRHKADARAMQELHTLEDLVADYVELERSTPRRLVTERMVHSSPADAPASRLHKLVGLSAAMAGDAAFARQARRKYL
jgi:hypothetical protein